MTIVLYLFLGAVWCFSLMVMLRDFFAACRKIDEIYEWMEEQKRKKP